MKLLVAAITFAATLGMLFLIGVGKSPQEDYAARLIEALKEENTGPAVPAILAPTQTPKQSSQLLQNSPLNQPKTPTPIPASTPTPSQTHASATTPTSTPPLLPSETLTPTPTPAPTQEVQQDSISVVSLTSPVQQNSTAQLTIATLSAAQCSIKVTLPSGNQSSAKGLEAKTTDTSGGVTWSWKINWNTTPGTATIEINCSKSGQNFSKSLQMVIVER